MLYAGLEGYVIGGIGSWESWCSDQAAQGAPRDPHVAPCNPVGTTCIRSFPQSTYLITFKAVAFSVAAIPLNFPPMGSRPTFLKEWMSGSDLRMAAPVDLWSAHWVVAPPGFEPGFVEGGLAFLRSLRE